MMETYEKFKGCDSCKYSIKEDTPPDMIHKWICIHVQRYKCSNPFSIMYQKEVFDLISCKLHDTGIPKESRLLRDKKDIENFKEKSKFLEKNGWVENWHHDCWIPKEWADDPTMDSDKAGVSIDNAYLIVKKELFND